MIPIMTVMELIALLAQLPPHAIVYVNGKDGLDPFSGALIDQFADGTEFVELLTTSSMKSGADEQDAQAYAYGGTE